MKILKVDKDGVVTYPIDIRKEFPYTSFPDPIQQRSLPAGYFLVDMPDHIVEVERGCRLVETDPIFDNGRWRINLINQKIEGEDLESLISEKRKQRNQKLFETDWSQLPDVPTSLSNKYVTYRQQLRDLPSLEGFPFVDFPEMPQ